MYLIDLSYLTFIKYDDITDKVEKQALLRPSHTLSSQDKINYQSETILDNEDGMTIRGIRHEKDVLLIPQERKRFSFYQMMGVAVLFFSIGLSVHPMSRIMIGL